MNVHSPYRWIVVRFTWTGLLSLFFVSGFTQDGYEHHRVESWDAQVGWFATGMQPRRLYPRAFHFYEIGISRSHIRYGGHHGPVSLIHHFAVGYHGREENLWSVSAGSSVQLWMVHLGANGVLYTDGHSANFKLRPQFGLGGGRVRAYFAFQIPTIYNRRLDPLRRAYWAAGVRWGIPFSRERTDL